MVFFCGDRAFWGLDWQLGRTTDARPQPTTRQPASCVVPFGSFMATLELLGSTRKIMADKKTVFVAFAIEDVTQRNLLRGQSLNTKCPFEYIDMSVKEPYDREWKERVRTRIRRSDGVIALVSKNSLTSSGQKWEIKCAKEEGVKLRGIHAYSDDKTKLDGVYTVAWTWDNIANFIDSL